jgi:GT2 family glycosyltransferase
MTRPAPDLRIDAVVPARDAEADIAACLDALAAAGLPPESVYVVDDGSRDDTAAIARARGARVLAGGGAGAAAARNLGAAAGDGEVILFCDADVTLHADAVDRVRSRFAGDPGLAALFGAYDADPLHPQAVSRIRNLLNHHVHATAAGPAHSFWTGIGAVRRRVFAEMGGLDPGQRMMEDIEFGLRLSRAGHRILLDPEVQGTHRKRWRVGAMMRSDLWDRAVPWTRLIHSDLGRDVPAQLNAGMAGKVSVAVVGAGLLSAAILAWAPVVGAFGLLGSVAGVGLANLGFLQLLRRLDGPGRALQGLGVLWLHFLCAGLGYVLARTGLARG